MKEVLIITYYWPPAGGPGVQRWLKFVKYLPTFGIKPVVFIPENPTYPITDSSLSVNISEEIEILRFPIKEPYGMAAKLSSKNSETLSKGIIPSEERQSFIQNLMLFIRGNFFVPDARKAWIKPSVNYLTEFLKERKIETVISSGPPHSLHLIGMSLKNSMDIQWMADFRDPWTTIGYHSKLKLLPWAKRKHKVLEKRVLNSADHIIVTSPTTRAEFETITNKPVTMITNGYDDFSIDAVELDKRFSISHVGTLLTDRNPTILWEVLDELCIEDNTFKSFLQINLIGSVGIEVLESLERNGLSRYLNLKGYVEHEEAVRYQRKSQLLLLVEIDSEDTRCIIPGKLFEYMASGRPILAVGPEDSDVEQLLKETNTGHYFLYDEKRKLKEAIRTHFDAFMKKELKSHGIGVKAFHRKNLTAKLAELIKK